MKRRETTIMGKLPSRLRFRKDLALCSKDLTPGRTYRPIMAFVYVMEEADGPELFFTFPDDRGVIRALPAWFFRVAK